MKAILEMNSPKGTVEEIYTLIKGSVKTGWFDEKNLEALVELTTELLNRVREENSGE